MAFLFLDFDGVMHPLNKGATFTQGPILWDVLREVPSLKVVISSSWREHYPLQKMKRLLTQNGGEHLDARIIGVTPDSSNTRRGDECMAWLVMNNHESAQWLALDDDPKLFDGYQSNFQHINPKTGLTHTDKEKIIRFFSQLK